MHPASYLCSAVFLLFTVPLVLVARDRKRSSRERIASGAFGALLWSAFLFLPGFSPIRGALDARRVDSLCARYAIGGRFDAHEFEAQAAARGLRAIVNPQRGYANAHALVILKVLRMCDIEYSDGHVTKITGGTHAP